MNNRQIDLLNIGLMMLSALLAFVFPFELFLFSYAVLGPLHYLTEIAWLKKRDYFTTSRNDYIFLVIMSLLLFSAFVFYESKSWAWAGDFYDQISHAKGGRLLVSLFHGSNSYLFIAFVAAVAMVIFKDRWAKIFTVIGAVFISLFLNSNQYFILIFTLLLPTLIHVFLFTGLFILYGALKNRSNTGYGSIVVFLLCSLSFFVFPASASYQVSPEIQESFKQSNFVYLNKGLMEFLGYFPVTLKDIFQSSFGQMLQRFVAFAYTYHYLNWFSKTTVIQWHKIPVKWLSFVIVSWVVSVALYWYSYRLGLIVLFFLSVLHVFLEFPLNYISIRGIIQELRAKKARAPGK